MTKRPQNKCAACNYTWYPRGKNLSNKCPDCGSRQVEYAPSGGGGLLAGLIGLAVVGYLVFGGSGGGSSSSNEDAPAPTSSKPEQRQETSAEQPAAEQQHARRQPRQPEKSGFPIPPKTEPTTPTTTRVLRLGNDKLRIPIRVTHVLRLSDGRILHGHPTLADQRRVVFAHRDHTTGRVKMESFERSAIKSLNKVKLGEALPPERTKPEVKPLGNDRLHLKSGKILHGRILVDNENSLAFQWRDAKGETHTKTFMRTDIAKVVKGSK